MVPRVSSRLSVKALVVLIYYKGGGRQRLYISLPSTTGDAAATGQQWWCPEFPLDPQPNLWWFWFIYLGGGRKRLYISLPSANRWCSSHRTTVMVLRVSSRPSTEPLVVLIYLLGRREEKTVHFTTLRKQVMQQSQDNSDGAQSFL